MLGWGERSIGGGALIRGRRLAGAGVAACCCIRGGKLWGGGKLVGGLVGWTKGALVAVDPYHVGTGAGGGREENQSSNTSNTASRI